MFLGKQLAKATNAILAARYFKPMTTPSPQLLIVRLTIFSLNKYDVVQIYKPDSCIFRCLFGLSTVHVKTILRKCCDLKWKFKEQESGLRLDRGNRQWQRKSSFMSFCHVSRVLALKFACVDEVLYYISEFEFVIV